MSFLDLLRLAIRNLSQSRLRAALTMVGVTVGVAMIVTMVSFGLGLQRNALARFKSLDLFNEIVVYGHSIARLTATILGGNSRRRAESGETSQRPLDDSAIAEISRIKGVESVEPNISFAVFVRANGKAKLQTVAGALVPARSNFLQSYAAGGMITADEQAVVSQSFVRDFGFHDAREALGQTIDFLAPRKTSDPRNRNSTNLPDSDNTFFGFPFTSSADTSGGKRQSESSGAEGLTGNTVRICGVLNDASSGSGDGDFRFRGLTQASSVYITIPTARKWLSENGNPLQEVALRLAREGGELQPEQEVGYQSAVVRVTDPAVLDEVRRGITALHFSSFSLVDQIEQLRTFFLMIDSGLGLLGGISLIVASFGIANTMIMSILERTREIGIMKAIGADDRQIKLIFFYEATVIGLLGGIAGALSAWLIDVVANHLAYRLFLKPRGASYVDFFALPFYLWLGAILVSLLVSIIAALYPAARAARVDPVTALRHD